VKQALDRDVLLKNLDTKIGVSGLTPLLAFSLGGLAMAAG
jgi:hypothetical protein